MFLYFRDRVNNKSPSFHGKTPRSNEPISFCLHAKYPSPSGRNTRLEFHRVISATRLVPNFLSRAEEPRHYSPRPNKTSPRGQSEVLRALFLFLSSFFSTARVDLMPSSMADGGGAGGGRMLNQNHCSRIRGKGGEERQFREVRSD